MGCSGREGLLLLFFSNKKNCIKTEKWNKNFSLIWSLSQGYPSPPPPLFSLAEGRFLESQKINFRQLDNRFPPFIVIFWGVFVFCFCALNYLFKQHGSIDPVFFVRLTWSIYKTSVVAGVGGGRRRERRRSRKEKKKSNYSPFFFLALKII